MRRVRIQSIFSQKGGGVSTDMIRPHGGKLVSRYCSPEELPELEKKALRLPTIVLKPPEVSDLEMISCGAMSPLKGFMCREEYESVVKDMHFRNGLPWSLPVVLGVDEEVGRKLKRGSEACLASAKGEPLAILKIGDKYKIDKRREAKLVFRTEDEAHPGVAILYRRGEVLLGGNITALRRPSHRGLSRYRLEPAETRKLFRERGWRTVVGFQTRNPIHRAHEYIQKCALEVVDGLLIHPLVGETKKGDVPATVRMRCYEVLTRKYYPPDRVVITVFPAYMRYGGPREAIFHAICRKNYGCSHFIVGRDHAGVGNYYGAFDAQHIFSEFDPEKLGITPLFFDNAFYCRVCGSMATSKTCPHSEKERVSLSGTQVREMLSRGVAPPPEFTRPEVAQILIKAYKH